MDAIILCAGQSKRFGGNKPKVLEKINFKPLIYYSINSFNDCPITDKIYIVVAEKDIELFQYLILSYREDFKKLKDIIIGGKERAHSVRNALNYLDKYSKPEFVAIHDGARPFIKQELIKKIYLEAKKHNAAAPGIKIIDTIKSVTEDMFIENHLTRDKLIAIQTPQIFKFKDILTAYNLLSSNESFTDDTHVWTKLNNKIKIVEGDRDLIKITYKEDLILAKIIYKRIKGLWR